jgi:Lrp/AsnC family transcriptional regulator, leucine-responsive regulatory protein
MNDEIDLKLVKLLQLDARMSNAELARQVGMAPSAVLERVRKLEERGLIRGYEARVDGRALGLGLVAFVFVRVEEGPAEHETAERLASLPEVQEVHNIAGEDCYLIKLRTRDTESLARFLRHRLGAIPGVRSTRTTIVLETIKESATVPVANGKGEPPGA